MSDLKNRGISLPVILISLVIVGVIGYSLFNDATSFGRAPLMNKVLGIGSGLFGLIFAFKSTSWLDFIESDKHKLWASIVITAIFGILALLLLGVWHSGPLGTLINPE